MSRANVKIVLKLIVSLIVASVSVSLAGEVAIKSISPESAKPQEHIEITGTGFDYSTRVEFNHNNGRKISALHNYTSAKLKVQVPDIPPGSVWNITATTSGKTSEPKTFQVASSPNPPSRPTNVKAIAEDAKAIVTFTPSAQPGVGSVRYTVKSTPGDKTSNGQESPITVEHLNNDTSYTFTVTATTDAGTSGASDPSEPVTTKAKLINEWLLEARVGAQTSTFSDGVVNKDEGLFSQNYAFIDLLLTVPKLMFDGSVDGSFLARVGRQNIEGQTNDMTDFGKAVKDASVVEGHGALIWKPFQKNTGRKKNESVNISAPTSDPIPQTNQANQAQKTQETFWKFLESGEGSTFYVKGALGGIYTESKALKDQDFLLESFGGIGSVYTETRSVLNGSLVEIGAGYSERFKTHLRFKGALDVKYNLKDAVNPFISFKWSVGSGPDDLVVYYGVIVDDPVAKIFSVFAKMLEGGTKTNLTPAP